jgi:hypothetical protein
VAVLLLTDGSEHLPSSIARFADAARRRDVGLIGHI